MAQLTGSPFDDATGMEKPPSPAPLVRRDRIETDEVARNPQQFFGYTKPQYFERQPQPGGTGRNQE